ncbi:MAG: hypothetical protein AAGI52_14830 [Bacteroidota bacterium]
MTVPTRPLHEIDRAGRAALVRELGVADALRFLRQYTTGSGDYTAEREQWQGDASLDELLDQAEQADRERDA